MELPFSRAEFVEVFAAYNQAIWPMQLMAAFAGATALVLPFASWRWRHRAISGVLASLWVFTGIAYHWSFFARVNSAAYLFAALFVLEGIVFAWEGLIRDRLRFFAGRDRLTTVVAIPLAAYGLIIYPLLGLLLTHPYPETPLFGVVPCPTAIFTLGLLATARHPHLLSVAAVPLAWSAVGGSAAILLAMPQDWVLLVAGALWLVMVHRRGSGGVSAA